jgi:hypothetical protein
LSQVDGRFFWGFSELLFKEDAFVDGFVGLADGALEL